MTVQLLITPDRLDIYEKYLKVRLEQVMAAYHGTRRLLAVLRTIIVSDMHFGCTDQNDASIDGHVIAAGWRVLHPDA